ncbi:uncharacterized protein N7483_004540 [Penicillium malachiteum]|uniref:uncharacterized protein n=1 Tax=Penicillium malachiteum TaxID=1324776 RepID=UPI002547F3AD|nr:uncharacterized protein N7483_004540 [Penicillium malachiteum]KAJ5730032.1 hypothetical protein N7483_004540 [Penicillium malachiteum]
MQSTRSWVIQGPMEEKYARDAIVTTKDPVPRQWKILRVVSEYDYQRSSEVVQQGQSVIVQIFPKPPLAEMRVHLQVPHTNTELQASQIRARQAVKFRPDELKFLKILTADPSTSAFTPKLLGYQEKRQGAEDLVLGGFHTIVVWEHLPGLPLGGPTTDPGSFGS